MLNFKWYQPTAIRWAPICVIYKLNIFKITWLLSSVTSPPLTAQSIRVSPARVVCPERRPSTFGSEFDFISRWRELWVRVDLVIGIRRRVAASEFAAFWWLLWKQAWGFLARSGSSWNHVLAPMMFPNTAATVVVSGILKDQWHWSEWWIWVGVGT